MLGKSIWEHTYTYLIFPINGLHFPSKTTVNNHHRGLGFPFDTDFFCASRPQTWMKLASVVGHCMWRHRPGRWQRVAGCWGVDETPWHSRGFGGAETPWHSMENSLIVLVRPGGPMAGVRFECKFWLASSINLVSLRTWIRVRFGRKVETYPPWRAQGS